MGELSIIIIIIINTFFYAQLYNYVIYLDNSPPGHLFVGKYPTNKFPSSTQFGVRTSASDWSGRELLTFNFSFPPGIDSLRTYRINNEHFEYHVNMFKSRLC